MANYSTTDAEIISIADAIRASSEKTGSLLYPTEFVTEIQKLHALGLVITSKPGITVTAKRNNVTYTSTETSSGVYEIPVPDYGTYTINVINGNKTSTAQVVVQKTAADVYPTYTITFLDEDGSTVLQSLEVVENEMPEYPDGHPRKVGYQFDHYTPELAVATQDQSYTAVFNDSITHQYLTDTLEHAVANVDYIRPNAFYYNRNMLTLETSATAIGNNAFVNCSKLTTINFTNSDPVEITSTSAMTGCTSLQHILLHSNTVNNAWTSKLLESIKITNKIGAFYVPSNLLNEYKSATFWSGYGDIIFPLESYPVTDFSTITDSWETIFASEANGTYTTKYSIGDLKQFTTSDGTVYVMKIVAMDKDVLADNTGNAKITWITRWSVPYTLKLHNVSTETDSWGTCYGRTQLRSKLDTFPEIIRNNIKEVEKTYYDTASSSTLSIADTIWIPSSYELNCRHSSEEDSGVRYDDVFTTSNATRVISFSGYVYTRTQDATNARKNVYITTSGNAGTTSCSTFNKILVGFCT